MQDNKNTTVIALCGKGGVGKTSLSAVTVRLLSEAYPTKRILAIDADPAVGLSTALGVDVISTVDDIRKSFVNAVEDGAKNAAIELLGEAKYQMLDAVVERDNISFLAIGRPEGAGCYCKVNAYLKEIINMLSSSYDFVVIDGEAGIEQVNRRVMERVSHLILVSDASRKGLTVVNTILDVASELVMFDKAGLIVNRIPDIALKNQLDFGKLELLSCIEDDSDMALNDISGKSVFCLDENTKIMQGARKALENIGIL